VHSKRQWAGLCDQGWNCIAVAIVGDDTVDDNSRCERELPQRLQTTHQGEPSRARYRDRNACHRGTCWRWEIRAIARMKTIDLMLNDRNHVVSRKLYSRPKMISDRMKPA
jgi:hypothetical protein